MTKNFAKSLEIIRNLDCGDQYYHNDSMFWFEKDPTVIFIVKDDGSILLRELFSDRPVSVYELWTMFSKEQKKIIAFNLDKFKW